MVVLIGSMAAIQAADVKGRLVVEVVDAEGNPLEGVEITLQAVETESLRYTIETDKKGRATLAGVDPILYHTTAEKDGYLPIDGNLKLRPGVKTKPTWTLLTMEQAKATQIATIKAGMTEEELQELAARDKHNQGIQAYQEGNYEEAKKYLEEAVELDPDISHLDYLLLGQFAFNEHNVEQTVTYLEKARELDTEGENTADIFRLLGACYKLQGQEDKAYEIWKEFVEKQPDPTVLYNLAAIEFAKDKQDKAIEWLEQAREKFPDYLEAQDLLGSIYLQQKEYQKAYDVYSNYLEKLKTKEGATEQQLQDAQDIITLLEEELKKGSN